MLQSGPFLHRLLQRTFQIGMLAVGLLLLAQTAQAELVYSKSRRFRIPFQFDASEIKRLGSREVQLYVSRDGGEHWKLVEGISPDTGKFTFEASEDGVYWFSVKTVAGSGLIYPAGPHQSSLNVLVDSTPPQLNLQLTEIEPGRVKLSWSAQDDHLDVSSLKLEYRDSSSEIWNVVAVRTQAYGQTTWTTGGNNSVQVRGQVSDLTGNQAQSDASCDMVTPVPREEKSDYGRPVAGESMQTPTLNEQPTTTQPVLTPRLTSAPARNETLAVQNAASNIPATPPAADQSSPLPVRGILKVNSDTFRIAYNLDGLGPSGVKQVDLYITEDNGQRWFYYGHDPDRVSPMEVTVPRDGEYGLAFRVTNGVGRVDIPPQPGDKPEVRISVDRSPPIVTMKPLEPGQDQEAHCAIITWSAVDQDLAERPIALFYSMAATGPWEPIPGWHPNTGRFVWKLPPTLDQPFYVRLDARDQAGNITKAYSEKPFVVDRATPRARVTEVEPVNIPAR